MENTLQVGDFLLVNKLVYGAEVPFTHKRLPRLREPQARRRDRVRVARGSDEELREASRRRAGRHLEMRDGTLIRNGAVVTERYVEHTEPDMDPAPEDFRWQREYLVRTRGGGHRHTIRHETTGVRWSSQKRTTSCSATIGTTRSTAGIGASCRTRWCKGRPFVIYYSYSPDTPIAALPGSRTSAGRDWASGSGEPRRMHRVDAR